MAYKRQQDSKGSSLSTQKHNSVSEDSSQKRKSNKSLVSKQPPSKKRKEAPAKSNNVKEAIKDEETLQGTGEHKTNVNEVGDSKSNKTKPSYADKCTAFLSNLSLEVNENHILGFFTDSGGVTSIRLLRERFSGKPRGLAYVDFSDEKHLAAAIAKNKQKLLGKKLSISRSDPTQGRNKSFSDKSFSDSMNSLGRGRGEVIRRDQKGPGEGSTAPSAGEENLKGEKSARSITFATPRSVIAKPLGWSTREARVDEPAEKLNSNDEFRQLLLKK